MNKDKKIFKQASELKAAQVNILHYAEMVKLAVQALQYIETGGNNMQNDESKILLLNQAGIHTPQNKVTPPKEVAAECLDIIRAMNEKHMDELKPGAAVKDDAPKTEVDHVRLIDGETITFSTDFDAMFHKCCSCSLTHEVRLEWIGLGTDTPKVRTKWFRRDSDPTIEELESKGEVVSLNEVTQ